MEEGGKGDLEGVGALTMYLVVLEPLYVVAQQPYKVKPTWIRPILQTRKLRMDEVVALTHGHSASKGQHHFPPPPPPPWMSPTPPSLLKTGLHEPLPLPGKSGSPLVSG